MAKTCESNGDARQRGSITPFADADRACHGLSLIEVLMAIFVVTVGLLGVVTLLPLSQKDASQGAIEDQVSLVGKSAWRDFVIRGMNRPGVWFYGNGQPVYDVDNGWLNEAGNPLPTTNNEGLPMNEEGLQIPPTFVLDPWLIARVLAAGGDPHEYHFGDLHDIPRATLWDVTQAGGLQELADELFMFSDDLVFQPLTNAGGLPRQLFSGAGYKRTSAGLFSWMAILAPEWTSELNPDSDPPLEVTPVPGLYRLSLVIFHRRPFSLDPSQNEQAYVAEHVSGGWGGADVSLHSNTGKLEVKRNQWIALVSTDPNVPPVLRWFRVTKTGGDPYTNGNELLLECALVGSYTAPNLSDGVFMGGSAKAVMVKGVVAVFEKVVSLDFN
jgi:hypothetical protein